MLPVARQRLYFLCAALFCLVSVSLVTIFVATREQGGFHYVKKQLIWAAVGSVAFWAAQRLDYRLLAKQAKWIYGAGLLLLISLYLFGKKVNGAVSWIDLGFVRLQPSEITRLTTLLLLAKLFEAGKGECGTLQQFIWFTSILLFPTGLILLQPDLGMALVYTSLLGCFFLLTRFSAELIRASLLLGCMLVLVGAVLLMVSPQIFTDLLRPHQWERLTSFLHPELDPLGSGYQYMQARSVVGSGQLGGMGVLWVLTANGGKLPEQHTDFIFAVIAQQWGFIGASLLLLLYFSLFYLLVQWAMKTPDPFASFFISGMVTMWCFQVFVNIGMNIGLSPITGLTLPFISYGGSSLVSNMLALGLIAGMKEPPPLWPLE